jgi:hypothetical protein
MVAQGILPFKYQADTHKSGATALTGLPVYLDLAHVLGLAEPVRRHLKVRQGTQGWSDAQLVMALVLLNLAGGDCVDNLRVLEGDEGLCRVPRRVELFGLSSRRERRATERRWCKERQRAALSPSSVFRCLERFHAYQPLNVWWAEQGLVIHGEFRDGNVEAVVLWLRERWGKSEEAHSIMKSDLAGGQFPSARFGANAAWWAIMLLALNLNEAMKRLVLGGRWVTARLKAIRFHFVHLPGRVLLRARQLLMQVRDTHPSLGILLAARQRILALASASPP